MIFYNTVMDDGYFSLRQMRMSVRLSNAAMCRPAGVCDTNGSIQWLLLHSISEFLDFTGTAGAL